MRFIDIFDVDSEPQSHKIKEQTFKGEHNLEMARKRTSETEIAVSQNAAAAPARRKTAPARKKHTPVSAVAEPVSAPAAALEFTEQPGTPVYQPTREDIAALAHSYWVERGYQGGPAEAERDWLRAERELASAAQAVNA